MANRSRKRGQGLVSVVVCSHNPSSDLLDTLASARAQTYTDVETILLDDTDSEEGKAVLRRAEPLVSRYIRQPGGIAAARNAGFRFALGAYVVPLNPGDLLAPRFVEACLKAFQTQPHLAFVYTDFGTMRDGTRINHIAADYNLYSLLDSTLSTLAALIRKDDWEAVGGYDEQLPSSYADWDFWLRLGGRGRHGYRLPKILCQSVRDESPPLEFIETLRTSHPELYSWQNRVHVKASWAPAVCVIGTPPESAQSIHDWHAVDSIEPGKLLNSSRAEAFLLPTAESRDAYTVEFAALAIWGGNPCVRLPDGSKAISRKSLTRCKDIRKLPAKETLDDYRQVDDSGSGTLPAPFEILRRHLINAELLSLNQWASHPLKSATRLLPFSIKNELNRRMGRIVFDLSWYLKFQTPALTDPDNVKSPARYMPLAPSGRQRVALITPHLGPGGAEVILLEIAAALGQREYEILLIATESRDSRWRSRWEAHTDHIYDLARIVPPSQTGGATRSIATNWQAKFILIQNTPQAYAAVPHIKKELSGTKIIDLNHSVAEARDGADLPSSVVKAAKALDLRIAISNQIQERLCWLGADGSKVRVVRAGIDLARFPFIPQRCDPGPRKILFAGRLDSNKRPLLLVDIALALLRRRGEPDFRIVVAGDGPEEDELRARVQRTGTSQVFVFRGQVTDIQPLLADSDLLVLLSLREGIPLVILEAYASGRPVVASDCGAIREVLDNSSGFLIAKGENEIEQFAEAIQILLENPELRGRMGMAGRKKVEAEYDSRLFRDTFRQLVTDLIQDRADG